MWRPWRKLRRQIKPLLAGHTACSVRGASQDLHSRYFFLQIYTSRLIYLGFYVAFNTVQVISRRVVGRAEETSTYSSSGFCTVNCRPTASIYQLSHLRPCREPNPGLRGGKRECYHSATVAPYIPLEVIWTAKPRFANWDWFMYHEYDPDFSKIK